uniref:Uncharacterized protein n=1 Tax=Meloidogyne enterolobii TaxID=390850 RepID=A0A6V7VDL3_MELEN|nr:unnamed protein product [Meloidogyne enterolobii]
MLGLLPMDLNTGPWTRKSSTLCSLLLLLTIAALAVPGQDKSEIVGLGRHTKDGENVTLVDNTVIANRANFDDLADCNFRKLYPDACDVTIEDDYIELRYNYGSKGCTVDLLSENKSNINTIKFTTGVRNPRGGNLTRCLDDGATFEKSHNNILPFVYSVNNTAIKRFNNKGPYNGTDACYNKPSCRGTNGKCMLRTFLEVSWSWSSEQVYAYTHLVGERVSQSVQQEQQLAGEMTFNLTISSASAFTMWFAKEKTFNATEDAVCVPQKDPIVEPVTWTITKGDHIGKHLLVFSLLQQNATFVYVDGKRKGSPGGPYCELFVQFDTANYSLLVVNTSATTAPPTTTTTAATTEAPTTGTSETPRTTTSSLPTP